MRRRQLGGASLLGLLLVAALVALAGGPAFPAGGGKTLVADGPAPDLILLYTGDVIGYLGPCG
jgi:hypothetical protein